MLIRTFLRSKFTRGSAMTRSVMSSTNSAIPAAPPRRSYSVRSALPLSFFDPTRSSARWSASGSPEEGTRLSRLPKHPAATSEATIRTHDTLGPTKERCLSMTFIAISLWLVVVLFGHVTDDAPFCFRQVGFYECIPEDVADDFQQVCARIIQVPFKSKSRAELIPSLILEQFTDETDERLPKDLERIFLSKFTKAEDAQVSKQRFGVTFQKTVLCRKFGDEIKMASFEVEVAVRQ